jgi:hypothetical protein
MTQAVTQAGENSAGGARRPELGKLRSRPPGQSSKPPKCEPARAPGPAWARPGRARTSQCPRIGRSLARPPAGPGTDPGPAGARAGWRADPEGHPLQHWKCTTGLEPERLPRAVEKLGDLLLGGSWGCAAGHSAVPPILVRARSASREWPQGSQSQWPWRGHPASR